MQLVCADMNTMELYGILSNGSHRFPVALFTTRYKPRYSITASDEIEHVG